MFRYSISMSCTYEEYKLHLREELGKIGYILELTGTYSKDESKSYVVSLPEGKIALVNIPYPRANTFYIGKFNAAKFLAAAAITLGPEGRYGEYWKCLQSYGEKFTKGKFYRGLGPLSPNRLCIIDNDGKITDSFPYPEAPALKKASFMEVLNQIF